MHIIGCNQRQSLCISEINQRLFGCTLFGEAVALEFDIEAITKDRMELVEHCSGRVRLPLNNQSVDRTPYAASQSNQTVRVRREVFQLHMRPLARLRLEISGGDQFA